MSPVLIFFLFLAVFVFLMVWGYIQQQKRREALSGFCLLNGLEFDPGKDPSIEDQFPALKCFQRGEERYAYNLMRGDWRGRPLLAFDYHYETESRDSKGRRHTTTHRFSAALLSSHVPLRPLFIRPEGFFDKVTEFFGVDDIDFESVEFSRAFYVKAEDKKWAYDVLHPRAMEFMLAQPRFNVQFDQFQVLVWRDRTFKPEEFAGAIALAEGLLDRLPNYLVKQQTEGV